MNRYISTIDRIITLYNQPVTICYFANALCSLLLLAHHSPVLIGI